MSKSFAMKSLCLVIALVALSSAKPNSPEPAREFENRLLAHKDLVKKLYEADEVHKTNSGVNWAVIVAGSSGYGNYRHQADVCHAYQIFHEHGIPDERIIVMMYDDIAHNRENPTPGVVVNHINGSDVYHGVLKDYTKDDVTPDNFVAVLTGDSSAVQGVGSGRVLQSGPQDHVFVNFADHGASDLIAFPYDVLHSRKLMNAINKMHDTNMYSKMVFYIEACESGSMFDKILPDNIDVYATTAANPYESSYACYWDDYRETYLGDVYSVNWMEDTDGHEINSESLFTQFQNVKQLTEESHVMQYGNLTIGTVDYVGEFQGTMNNGVKKTLKRAPITDAVPQGDAPLMRLKKLYQKAKTTEARALAKIELDALVKKRAFIVDTVHAIVEHASNGEVEFNEIIGGRRALHDHDCYEAVVAAVHQKCFNLGQTDYALRHLYAFVNLCESGVGTEEIVFSVNRIC